LYELKKHKPRLDERKQAKLQWLRGPVEINGNKLAVGREDSRYYRNKKRGYLTCIGE
jgi:hypothetical protein